MNLFTIKRGLLAPYVWFMRRRYRAQLAAAPQALVAIVEAQYFRPTLARWLRDLQANPDLPYEAPLDASSVVFDCGAFVGDWSAKIAEKYDPSLYLFEPNPGCFPGLYERFSGNAKVRCFEYGLHDADARRPLVQTGPGSSVFPETMAPNAPTSIVDVRDVLGVMDEIGCSHVDLVKLNIEGGEYEVLERLLETGRIRDIRCLLVQFHEWRERAYARRWRIRRALRQSHDLDWDYPFIWEKWTRR
jgi:FkbM family methyltransferase